MIAAALHRNNGLTQRLAAKAARLAAAYRQSAHLAIRQNPTRWRRADLLWPLFFKD